MSLQHLAKYQLTKEEQLEIRGNGEGTVVCADGATFSASASSMDSVRRGGERWCQDHGHGSAVTFLYVGEGEFSF